MTPVCTLMFGRLDDWLRIVVERDGLPVDPGALDLAGIAVFKRATHLYRERGYRTRLLGGAYRTLLHWTELVGADAILTITHAWQVRIEESGLAPVDRIDVPVDPAAIAALEGIEDFRRAYAPDGMTIAEFDGVRLHGPHAPPVHRVVPRPRRDGPRDRAARPGGALMSRPLGIAVVGCGNVSTRFHIPAYRKLGGRVRVVALADVSPERIAEARAACGDAGVVTSADWREVIARPDVDIVDVATPPRLHAEIAEAAAAAGKHVLCEKPITTIPAEAVRMIAACRAAGVTLGVWHNWAFYPEVLAAEAIVASGEIGEVRLALVDYLGVPDNLGAGETVRSWRHDPVAAGGGVLIDMLHCLYITEQMIGHRARRVSAWVSGNADHPQVEATALCRLETDGPVALVNVGWGRGPGGVFIEGMDGTLETRWVDGGTGPSSPSSRSRSGARMASAGRSTFSGGRRPRSTPRRCAGWPRTSSTRWRPGGSRA